MSAAVQTPAELPPVRGKYLPAAALDALTWFRVGGVADVLFLPADMEDLQAFLRAVPRDMPLHILGAGSNTLVRDGGVRGVCIRLGKAFAQIAIDGAQVQAGAAVLDAALARAAQAAGMSGFEFLRGIPGSIGGALAMNAGAYGSETAAILTEARALDRDGKLHVIRTADMGFGYRSNGLDPNLIFVAAKFCGAPDAAAAIQARMDNIMAARETSQPVKSRTGGSTFKNPGGRDPNGPKAWKLIEAAGCRGLREGDAQVSEQHCNFLINHGGASASDIETLAETVRARVVADCGITLDWEIRRIGAAA